MRAVAVLFLVLASSAAQAQSANDLVLSYLSSHTIAWVTGDYQTCWPEGGSDGICAWNTAKLGPQPTAADLQALAPAWRNQQEALQYDAKINAGIVVTSTGTPSLDGTYAADQDTQGRLSAIVAGIAAGQGLPGNGATFLHQDKSGAPHPFTSAQIVALAKATRDYFYALTLTRGSLLTGTAAAWPSNEVTVP